MRLHTILLLTTAVVISAPAAAQTYLGTWSANCYDRSQRDLPQHSSLLWRPDLTERDGLELSPR